MGEPVKEYNKRMKKYRRGGSVPKDITGIVDTIGPHGVAWGTRGTQMSQLNRIDNLLDEILGTDRSMTGTPREEQFKKAIMQRNNWTEDKFKEVYGFQEGGYLQGPSHDQGGIPIEAEGGEYIVKADSVTPETKPLLEAINQTGTNPMKKYKYGGHISPMKSRGGYQPMKRYQYGGQVGMGVNAMSPLIPGTLPTPQGGSEVGPETGAQAPSNQMGYSFDPGTPESPFDPGIIKIPAKTSYRGGGYVRPKYWRGGSIPNTGRPRFDNGGTVPLDTESDYLKHMNEQRKWTKGFQDAGYGEHHPYSKSILQSPFDRRAKLHDQIVSETSPYGGTHERSTRLGPSVDPEYMVETINILLDDDTLTKDDKSWHLESLILEAQHNAANHAATEAVNELVAQNQDAIRYPRLKAQESGKKFISDVQTLLGDRWDRVKNLIPDIEMYKTQVGVDPKTGKKIPDVTRKVPIRRPHVAVGAPITDEYQVKGDTDNYEVGK